MSKYNEIGKKIRLQKYLAEAGIGSRRRCEEIILEGDVSVNGRIVDTLPSFVYPDQDDIRVAGRKVKPTKKEYYLLNKPKGVICTNYDPQGRKRAIEFVETKSRIFCAGRLDADTTGAIILTNDPEIVHKLTHPSYEFPKVYEVHIQGIMEGDTIEKLKSGVWLSEGKTGRASVKVLFRSHDKTVLQVTIKQSLNRQIRRTFARLGFKVRSLKRIKIGKLGIKGIPLGGYKMLSEKEIKNLIK